MRADADQRSGLRQRAARACDALRPGRPAARAFDGPGHAVLQAAVPSAPAARLERVVQRALPGRDASSAAAW
ncbi:MAG: hypothetical protein MZW92_72920 [Comamonadaceae bacterium]|nr:hypothetical protein [Comamonadaceae bacterium]